MLDFDQLGGTQCPYLFNQILLRRGENPRAVDLSRSGQSYSDDMAIESEVNFHGHTRDVFVGWLDSDHTPKIVIVESGEHDHWAKVVERCHPDITPIDDLVGPGRRVHCVILVALPNRAGCSRTGGTRQRVAGVHQSEVS